MNISTVFKVKIAKWTAVFAAVLLVSISFKFIGQWLVEYEEANVPHYSQANDDAWGNETLASVGNTLQNLSPIPLANACGLGASSCFRCHNDRRATAPNKGPDAPWHVEHDKVNYSCAGCHQGNPRILKKDIAHSNLIANSVAAPEKTCASCHGVEADAKAKVYLDKHPHLQGK